MMALMGYSCVAHSQLSSDEAMAPLPNGVIFMSREDEEGEMQLFIYRTNSDKRHLRPVVLGERLMVVTGRWQRQGEVCDIIAGHPEACLRSWRAGDEEPGFR
ncbi:hypothetical protein [Comamonas terrigena]|uniref:hypothetical protein n=1 Tax=Comamonas terrigena TaxID=32013 RepID=UPI002897F95B|nr:hypothetical protein [Comamonas terrigena]